MLNQDEVRNQLERYLAGNESVNDLEDWLSGELAVPSQAESVSEARHLSLAILNRLSVFLDGVMDEASLRQELNRMLRPKALEARVRFDFFDDNLDQPVPPPLKPDIRPSGSSVVQEGFAVFA